MIPQTSPNFGIIKKFIGKAISPHLNENADSDDVNEIMQSLEVFIIQCLTGQEEFSILGKHMNETEKQSRKWLWLNHGHDGLYGDDGEMQCGKCRPYDYLRAPYEQVAEAAVVSLLSENKKLSERIEELGKRQVQPLDGTSPQS